MNGPKDTAPEQELNGEQLMAYLDGELDEDNRREIDERLANDAELRQQMKEFQQTWDLLDELPREPVDDTFTRITVEMVAVQAEGEAKQQALSLARFRVLGWGIGIAVAIAAGVAGFAWSHWKLAEPNRRLVEDLPLLQHLDAYQNADSIDFLRMLDREGLFKEDDGDGN